VVGSGEKNTSLKQINLPPYVHKVVATFGYGDDKSALKPSAKLTSGGPYAFGSYRMMLIAAENGDDEDDNDAVVEIKGYMGG
jgi:hypothetical protein